MTDAITRLTAVLSENGHTLPEHATVPVRVGDLRQLLQGISSVPQPNPIPVLDRLRSAD